VAHVGGWVHSGLLRTGPDLVGSFRLPGGGRVQGRLVADGDAVSVFVQQPPRRGIYAHECCLQLIRDGWFKLHFARPPHSFEAAIAFTEHFLTCCHEGRRYG